MAAGTARRAATHAALLAMVLVCAAHGVSAAVLEVAVQNDHGEPVENSVIYATSEDDARSALAGGQVMIDQKGKEFIPHVMAVRAGTSIQFPNSDNIRHHVYSFSPAKTFEIPLYKGMPARPIVFDKPGVVVLGCNIHDWMSAFVFVSETPYYAVTGADGRAVLKNLPAGRYEVKVWHPLLKDAPDPASHRVVLESAGKDQLAFGIKQKRAWGVRREGRGLGGGYR